MDFLYRYYINFVPVYPRKFLFNTLNRTIELPFKIRTEEDIDKVGKILLKEFNDAERIKINSFSYMDKVKKDDWVFNISIGQNFR